MSHWKSLLLFSGSNTGIRMLALKFARENTGGASSWSANVYCNKVNLHWCKAKEAIHLWHGRFLRKKLIPHDAIVQILQTKVPLQNLHTRAKLSLTECCVFISVSMATRYSSWHVLDILPCCRCIVTSFAFCNRSTRKVENASVLKQLEALQDWSRLLKLTQLWRNKFMAAGRGPGTWVSYLLKSPQLCSGAQLKFETSSFSFRVPSNSVDCFPASAKNMNIMN